MIFLVCHDGAKGAESSAKTADFAVRAWGQAEGLPDASVTAILQTRDSYLWVGTSAGLFRFDGVLFTEWRLSGHNPGAPEAITTLCEDQAGRVWAGSEQHGLLCLEGTSVKRYAKAEGLLDEGVTSLTVDAGGGLWIGTRRGLNFWNGNHFASFTRRDGLPDEWVTSVHAARSLAVWVTTHGGMCRVSQGKMETFEFPSSVQGRNPEWLGAYEDARSNLWVFGASYLINLTESKRFNYFHGEEPSSMRIWSLCGGRDGRLWIGTSGRGLFCFDGNKFEPVTPSEGTCPSDVRAICEDDQGNLWLGVPDGGLARLRPQTQVLFKGKQGLPNGAAACVALDAFRRVVVALEDGLLFLNQGDRFESSADRSGLLAQEFVSCLSAGDDGSLWAGTLGSGLYQMKGGRVRTFATANGLSDDWVQSVCTDAEEAVWIGTRGGGLHRIKDSTLTAFGRQEGWDGSGATALLRAREGGIWIGTASGLLLRGGRGPLQRAGMGRDLPKAPILSIHEDVAGRMWLGTAGAGLWFVDARNSIAWGPEQGLPDNLVSGVTSDSDGNLWLLTGKGVYCVSQNSLGEALNRRSSLRPRLVVELSDQVGRPRRIQTGARALRAPDGRLWFATPDGLVRVDPHVGLTTPPPPPVYIEGIAVNDRSVDVPSGASEASVRTPAKLRALAIRFTALNFAAPDKLKFRHKMEGIDADWVDSGQERRVRYGGLPPGRYTFRVSARNPDGEWNGKEGFVAFTIPAPLWRSPLSLVLYVLVATGSVAGIVRVVSHRRLRTKLARLEQQQAMERERVRIAQDMHDEIGSKLTKISFLSERARAEVPGSEPVAGKIDSIANTSREVLKALDEIVWAVNPRNDTLEHLAAYLAQYAAEYFQNTTVDCDLRLQGELPHYGMSAEVRHNLFLAFEEALNNVLKHSSATHVRIGIGIEQERFQIEITDDGRGFASMHKQSSSTQSIPAGNGPGGNGLNNMRERLADVGGACVIESAPGKGTAVRLSIPVRSSKLHPV